MIEFYFLITLFCICLSVIFTTSETSIFSLSRIERISLQSFGIASKYLQMLKYPEELLIVLIVGNEIVDFFSSFYLSKGFTHLFHEKGRLIAYIISALLGFWIGEFFPKLIGFRFKTSLLPKILLINYILFKFFYPFRKLYSFISQRLEKAFSYNSIYSLSNFYKISPVEEIILYMLDVAYKQGKITDKERKFIRGLFISEKTPVSAILTPRSQIVAFEDQIITLEFLEKLKYLPYNKFPVYKGDLDNVIGILYTKDLIKDFSYQILNQKKLSDFLRTVYFIPESFKVRDLLFEFQKRQTKIALVIDEYGILKGLITLEDVLEELFGEIYEEKEDKIKPIKKIDEKRWLIQGKMLLDELKIFLNIEIEEEFKEIKTLNGFLLTLFRGIPKEGDRIEYKDFIFTIKKIKRRKISLVEVEKKEND